MRARVLAYAPVAVMGLVGVLQSMAARNAWEFTAGTLIVICCFLFGNLYRNQVRIANNWREQANIQKARAETAEAQTGRALAVMAEHDRQFHSSNGKA